MKVDTNALVSMTDANQNFSKVTRLVDEQGIAVILKNNTPKYVVVNFKEYDEIKAMREKIISEAAKSILDENIEAFKELAK
jgi:prevent-host-death family protein